MGLFSSKKKVTTTTNSTSNIEYKLVKLSYLETLAIQQGLGKVDELAGITEASTITAEGDPSTVQDKITKAYNKNSKTLDHITLATGSIIGHYLNKGIKSAFGKSTSVNVKTTIKDSGWSLVKTWNQPQFDVIRYAIGIKELTVAQFTYEQVSELISIPWESPKEINKISLFIDQFIPSEFPSGDSYIEFYIKPNIENASWIRINGIGLPTVFNADGTIVPRIISFNTEKPVTSLLEQAYVNTTSPVKSIRFKAVLKRPSTLADGTDASAYSPILKSYKLIMTPRSGL